MTIYWGDGTTTSTNPTGGKVLQVQSTTKTSTYSQAIGSGNYGSYMGLNVSITPSSTSHKILVMVHCNLGMNSSARCGWVCYRGGSVIDGWRGASNEGSSRARYSAGGRTSSNNHMTNATSQYLDSPSTTSSVTYSVRLVGPDGYRNYLNRAENQSNEWSKPISSSNITVMEIS